MSIDICRTMLKMFYGFVVAIAMLNAGMRQHSRMRVGAMLQEGKNNTGQLCRTCWPTTARDSYHNVLPQSTTEKG